jgi:hypothetical protein
MIFSAAVDRKNDGKCAGKQHLDHRDNYADRGMTREAEMGQVSAEAV